MSVFQANIGCRFAPPVTLLDEDADLDSMVIHFNKQLNFLASNVGRGGHEILDLCDQRRDLKKKEASQNEPKTIEN